MTKLFSQRYGYTSLEDIVIRENMPEAIQNAIINWYDMLPDITIYNKEGPSSIKAELEEYLWSKFLNKRTQDYYDCCRIGNAPEVFVEFISDADNPWYRKLDILEVSLTIINSFYKNIPSMHEDYNKKLNEEFSRLNYAYRIVNNTITEITSKEEIKAVETAIANNNGAIKMHLSKALELCAKRPEGDYRNSIKESISAVEKWCREKTNENDLRKALNKLESKGIIIHSRLHSAFNKLYEYTNNEETGIRHALMDDDGTYTPSIDEAVYMVVTCSAFINYLNKKTLVL